MFTLFDMKDHWRSALAVFVLAVAVRIRRLREDSSALPYSQRLWAEFTRPFVTRARLREMLGPEGGSNRL